MEIRKLNAARGWIWVKQGWQLILRNPLMAVSFALIGSLLVFASLHLPLFGPLLALLLMPVLLAGYMRMCRALEEDEEAELTHLFEGFQKHTPRLIALGAFAMLGMLLASLAMILVGGEAFTGMLEDFQSGGDPQALMQAMWSAGSGVALGLLVGLSLMFVLMLALQYAPMLVFFSGLTPVAALRMSLAGSLRNMFPYAVYTIIMQLIALVLGFLPFGLGLIVLLPLGLTSLFVSYRNIFPFPGELQAVGSAPSATEG